MIGEIKKSLNYLRDRLWYIITIAVLALASGGMLIYEFYAKNANDIIIKLFQDLDLTIAYIFLVDFLAGMYASPGKKLSYVRKNWLDLLGSIPIHDGFFRAMRILRFTRLVRFIRAANTGLNIQDSIKDLSHSDLTEEDEKEKS